MINLKVSFSKLICIFISLYSINTFSEENELIKRKNKWVEPKLKVDFGSLYKYAKTVSSASKGCVTDEF